MMMIHHKYISAIIIIIYFQLDSCIFILTVIIWNVLVLYKYLPIDVSVVCQQQMG